MVKDRAKQMKIWAMIKCIFYDHNIFENFSKINFLGKFKKHKFALISKKRLEIKRNGPKFGILHCQWSQLEYFKPLFYIYIVGFFRLWQIIFPIVVHVFMC